jgi:hypothetical protein
MASRRWVAVARFTTKQVSGDGTETSLLTHASLDATHIIFVKPVVQIASYFCAAIRPVAQTANDFRAAVRPEAQIANAFRAAVRPDAIAVETAKHFRTSLLNRASRATVAF